jgi:hypothetical protein
MTQFIDDEQRPVVHREPTKAKKGQRQRRIRRSNSGEPLIGRDSQVIQADIKGNPRIKGYAAQFKERLASRRQDFKPNEQ